jgi:hypothetical protein
MAQPEDDTAFVDGVSKLRREDILTSAPDRAAFNRCQAQVIQDRLIPRIDIDFLALLDEKGIKFFKRIFGGFVGKAFPIAGRCNPLPEDERIPRQPALQSAECLPFSGSPPANGWGPKHVRGRGLGSPFAGTCLRGGRDIDGGPDLLICFSKMNRRLAPPFLILRKSEIASLPTFADSASASFFSEATPTSAACPGSVPA